MCNARPTHTGEIILYDGFLSVYKHSLDLIIYIIADQTANELMLLSALVSFADASNMLLRNQLEKRSVLENLDLVLLCLDETIDDGRVLFSSLFMSLSKKAHVFFFFLSSCFCQSDRRNGLDGHRLAREPTQGGHDGDRH
jgi:hypothetical protein